TVRDPELDEPITALGFVASCTVSAGGDARGRLRLPTYFCAPNFAFLMVADAYDAVSGVAGVRSTEVGLEGHLASEAVNGGGAAQSGGGGAGELPGLRGAFLRRAVLPGPDQVCGPLRAAGASRASLLAMPLGEVPGSGALARLRQRRAELGLPAGPGAPLLIDPATGERIREEAAPLHLRRARATRGRIEGNSSNCRGLLRDPDATPGPGE